YYLRGREKLNRGTREATDEALSQFCPELFANQDTARGAPRRQATEYLREGLFVCAWRFRVNASSRPLAITGSGDYKSVNRAGNAEVVQDARPSSVCSRQGAAYMFIGRLSIGIGFSAVVFRT